MNGEHHGKKNKETGRGTCTTDFIAQYHPQTVDDMKNTLKDIFEPMFEAILQREMDSHFGYRSNDHGAKTTDNRRNGYTHKNVKTTHGNIEISVPCDRSANFELQLILRN